MRQHRRPRHRLRHRQRGRHRPPPGHLRRGRVPGRGRHVDGGVLPPDARPTPTTHAPPSPPRPSSRRSSGGSGGDGGAIVCTTISGRAERHPTGRPSRPGPPCPSWTSASSTAGPWDRPTPPRWRWRWRCGTRAETRTRWWPRWPASGRRQRLFFALETLEYLHRGGRIGGAQALAGTVLSIKPILSVTEGRIESVDRVRTYPRALTRLVDEVAAAANAWGPTKVIRRPRRQARARPRAWPGGWRRSPGSRRGSSRSAGCSAAMPVPAASASACTLPRCSRAEPAEPWPVLASLVG